MAEPQFPDAVRERYPIRRLPATILQTYATPASGSRVHTSITVRFGKRLRALRESHKMTQVELAQYLGIDRSFISDVERARKTISLSYLETIAQGFNLPIDKLLEGL